MGYEIILKRIYSHSISDKYVNSIKPEDIEEYLSSLKGNLKNATIKKHYVLLQSVFNSLEKEHIIKRNIFLNVEKPKAEDFEIDRGNIYDYKELKRLIETISYNFKLNLAVNLAALLGLRRSEIVGLKWENVYFKENYIFVKNSIVVVKGKFVEKTTKTKNSKRKMEMPPVIRAMLLEEHKRQKKIEKTTNLRFKYVFSNYDDASCMTPDYITRTFGRTLKKYNLKHIRFHDLRHTFASLANNLGITLYDISVALGHSSTSITSKIYVHLFDDTNKGIVTMISEHMANENKNDIK